MSDLDGMLGGSMMWGAGLIWLLVVVALALGIAALIKYLRSQVAGVKSSANSKGTSLINWRLL